MDDTVSVDERASAPVSTAIDMIEDYLLLWILLAVGLGLLVPQIALVTRASTLVLAVMIGSISLTLSIDRFRDVDRRTLGLVLVGHVTMPFLAFGIARGLGLSPAITIGFVVLGAVTPELVTPVMTTLAGGDTALSTTTLVLTGVGSIGFIPAVVALLVGSAAVPTTPLVQQLILAVVLPMVLAITLRAWKPDHVERYDDVYPAVSAVMVVLIIGGVTAANAAVIYSNAPVLLAVGIGAIGLNVVGYGVGAVVGKRASRPARIACILSVGMRDFAVAAALVLAAGLPTIASVPAVAFGVVEMTTSAGLARWFSRRE